MSAILFKEINNLKKLILSLSARVEEAVQMSTKAVADLDPGMAASVIEKDVDIDQMEVEVEEECLKILALHQPVATDLRFIVACLKLNNDLERIGDLGVNIARRVLYLTQSVQPVRNFDFRGMMEKSRCMLKKSLDALVNLDGRLAREVCAADDEVDSINKKIRSDLVCSIRENPDKTELFIRFMEISRSLERIADHATNIAEDVIYMTSGEIPRHGADAPPHLNHQDTQDMAR